MTDNLIPPLLMAVGSIVIGLLGAALSRRGQKDTHEQQEAANKLQTRVNTVEELESVIDHLKQDRDYAEAIIDKLRAQHTEEAERQAARCQAQLDRLIDNVATLQSVVTDEIARTAALDAVRIAQDHEATDHDRTWRPDETRY